MSALRYLWVGCLVMAEILCVQVFYTANTVEAQSSNNAVKAALSVGPAIIEKTLTPGKKTSFMVTVRNITTSPLPVSSYVRGFTVQSTEFEKTDASRLDASQWFVIEEPDFILQPNEEQTIKGTILPPLNVEPGGHYATIFFQPLASENENNQSIAQINARVGVLAFLSVEGKVVENGRISGVLEIPKLPHPGPITMKFKVENTGNVHIMPKGSIDIHDWLGNEVSSVPIPVGIILPNSTREYIVPWTVPSTIWKYKAELSLQYGKSNKQLEKSSIIFWSMPLGEMVVGSVSALLVALFIFKTHRRWARAWRALRAGSSTK